VSVDRRHDRPRGIKHGQERLVEHRQELRDIRCTTVADSPQVDPGRENSAGTGEHDRLGIGVRTNGLGDCLAKFDIQGTDLAVHKPDHSHTVTVLHADHLFHAGTPFHFINRENWLRPRVGAG